MYTIGVIVGPLGIHVWPEGILGGHGSKVEVAVERLKQGNIELRTTIFGISMYFWTTDWSWVVIHLQILVFPCIFKWQIYHGCHYGVYDYEYPYGTSTYLGWSSEHGVLRTNFHLVRMISQDISMSHMDTHIHHNDIFSGMRPFLVGLSFKNS